jgi:serine protease inhibitor
MMRVTVVTVAFLGVTLASALATGAEPSHDQLVEDAEDLYDLNKLEEAAQTAERAFSLGLRRFVEPERDWHVYFSLRKSMRLLSDIYEDLNEYERLEPMYREYVAAVEDVHGKTSISYANSVLLLAGYFEYASDYEEAEPLLLQAVEIAQALPISRRERAEITSHLALFYESAGKYEEAEVLLLEVIVVLQPKEEGWNPVYVDCLDALVSLYRATDEPAKAEPHLLALIEARERHLWHPNFDLVGDRNALAELYVSMAAYDKAESLYIKILDFKKEFLGEDHPSYASSLEDLASVYEATEAHAPLQEVGDKLQRYERTLRASLAINDFAFHLHGQLASEYPGQSLFFSPYSLQSALAAVTYGARTVTRSEMAAALSYPDDGADDDDVIAMLEALAALNRRFSPSPDHNLRLQQEIAAKRAEAEAADDDAALLLITLQNDINTLLTQVNQYELRLATALWCDMRLPLRTEYLDGIQELRPSQGIYMVDFRSDPRGVQQRIDEWASEQTTGRIPRLNGQVDNDSRLVITDAIYFKGEWSSPFDEDDTEPDAFWITPGTSRSVDLMHLRLDYCLYAAFRDDGSLFPTPRRILPDQTEGLYPESGTLVVDLPYKGEDISMLLMVPCGDADVADAEKILSADRLTQWVDDLSHWEVKLAMPRFKLEKSYPLSSAFQSLGMRRPFVPPGSGGADLSGMYDPQGPNDGLYIADIAHRALVEVNEKGTEAVAFTDLITVGASPARRTVPFVPTVRADRPFLFLIRDRATGTILFVGRFTGPDA